MSTISTSLSCLIIYLPTKLKKNTKTSNEKFKIKAMSHSLLKKHIIFKLAKQIFPSGSLTVHTLYNIHFTVNRSYLNQLKVFFLSTPNQHNCQRHWFLKHYSLYTIANNMHHKRNIIFVQHFSPQFYVNVCRFMRAIISFVITLNIANPIAYITLVKQVYLI